MNTLQTFVILNLFQDLRHITDVRRDAWMLNQVQHDNPGTLKEYSK